METDTMMMPKVHHGKNIKRFRDILGVKQEVLAVKLNLSQQAVSRLEQKEEVDDETLNEVAKVFQVPIEAIKNMTDEGAVNIVTNTFNSNDTSTLDVSNPTGLDHNQNYEQCTFNPMDKIVELYERLLEFEREKNK